MLHKNASVAIKTSQTTEYPMRYGPFETATHDLSKPTVACQGREKSVSLWKAYIWSFELVTCTLKDRPLFSNYEIFRATWSPYTIFYLWMNHISISNLSYIPSLFSLVSVWKSPKHETQLKSCLSDVFCKSRNLILARMDFMLLQLWMQIETLFWQ